MPKHKVGTATMHGALLEDASRNKGPIGRIRHERREQRFDAPARMQRATRRWRYEVMMMRRHDRHRSSEHLDTQANCAFMHRTRQIYTIWVQFSRKNGRSGRPRSGHNVSSRRCSNARSFRNPANSRNSARKCGTLIVHRGTQRSPSSSRHVGKGRRSRETRKRLDRPADLRGQMLRTTGKTNLALDCPDRTLSGQRIEIRAPGRKCAPSAKR